MDTRELRTYTALAARLAGSMNPVRRVENERVVQNILRLERWNASDGTLERWNASDGFLKMSSSPIAAVRVAPSHLK